MGNFDRRTLALHARGADDDVRVGVPSPQHVDDVANRGAFQRRHDSDLARERGQRTFPRAVEESFRFEPLLQLIEGQLQRAQAVRLEMLADQLILALRLVHRNPAARDDAQAVHRLELEVAQRRPEHEPAQLAGGVLQGEIQVAGVPDPAIRQLTLHPHFEELGLDEIAQPDGELGDRKRSARLGNRCGRRRRRHRAIVLTIVLFKREVEQVGHGGQSSPAATCACAERAISAIASAL